MFYQQNASISKRGIFVFAVLVFHFLVCTSVLCEPDELPIIEKVIYLKSPQYTSPSNLREFFAPNDEFIFHLNPFISKRETRVILDFYNFRPEIKVYLLQSDELLGLMRGGPKQFFKAFQDVLKPIGELALELNKLRFKAEKGDALLDFYIEEYDTLLLKRFKAISAVVKAALHQPSKNSEFLKDWKALLFIQASDTDESWFNPTEWVAKGVKGIWGGLKYLLGRKEEPVQPSNLISADVHEVEARNEIEKTKVELKLSSEPNFTDEEKKKKIQDELFHAIRRYILMALVDEMKICLTEQCVSMQNELRLLGDVFEPLANHHMLFVLKNKWRIVNSIVFGLSVSDPLIEQPYDTLLVPFELLEFDLSNFEIIKAAFEEHYVFRMNHKHTILSLFPDSAMVSTGNDLQSFANAFQGNGDIFLKLATDLFPCFDEIDALKKKVSVNADIMETDHAICTGVLKSIHEKYSKLSFGTRNHLLENARMNPKDVIAHQFIELLFLQLPEFLIMDWILNAVPDNPMLSFITPSQKSLWRNVSKNRLVHYCFYLNSVQHMYKVHRKSKKSLRRSLST